MAVDRDHDDDVRRVLRCRFCDGGVDTHGRSQLHRSRSAPPLPGAAGVVLSHPHPITITVTLALVVAPVQHSALLIAPSALAVQV